MAFYTFGKAIKLFRSKLLTKKYLLLVFLLKKKAICLFLVDLMEGLIYGKLFLRNIIILLIKFKNILLRIYLFLKLLNLLNLIYNQFVLVKSILILIFVLNKYALKKKRYILVGTKSGDIYELLLP
jgi:hypothetical protein